MARKGDPSTRTAKHIRMLKWQKEQKRVRKLRELRYKVCKLQAEIRLLEEDAPIDPQQATLNAWVQIGPKQENLNAGVIAPPELLTLNDAPVPESNGQQTNPLIEWTVSEYKHPEPEVVDLDLEVATPSTEGGPYNDYLTLSLINNF